MTIATVADGGQAAAVDVVILKIAFNSAIISAGASNFPLAWPPQVIKMFQIYAVGSATVIGDSLSTDCVLRDSIIRPVQMWAIAALLSPPIIVMIFAFAFCTISCCARTKRYIKIHLPVSTIITLLFAHPVVTKAAVKLVACRNVAGKKYMDADFNISCDSIEYKTWALTVAVPLFIGFTFGVPIFYGLILFRHVKNGNLEKHRSVYGFLFSGFRLKAWWFELWNTIRKALFTIVAVLFRPSGPMLQTWAALVLLLVFIVVFSLASPYEHAYLNRLESWALTINVTTLLFGLGLFTNDKMPGEQKNETFAYIVSISIMFFNGLFIFTVIWTLIRSPHGEYCICCSKLKLKEKRIRPDRKRDQHVYAALKMRNKLENAIAQKKMTMVTPVKSDKHVYAALKMRNKLENAVSVARTQSKLRRKNTIDKLVENIEDEHTQYLKIKQKSIEMEKTKRHSLLLNKVESRKRKNSLLLKKVRSVRTMSNTKKNTIVPTDRKKSSSWKNLKRMIESNKRLTNSKNKKEKKHVFGAQLDLNDDDKDAVEKIRIQIVSKVKTEKRLTKIFNNIDLDRSNSIDRKEFHTLLTAALTVTIDDVLFEKVWNVAHSKSFFQIDLLGLKRWLFVLDEQVDRVRFVVKKVLLNQSILDQFMKRMDTKNTGQLTKSAFIFMIQSIIKKLGGNNLKKDLLESIWSTIKVKSKLKSSLNVEYVCLSDWLFGKKQISYNDKKTKQQKQDNEEKTK